jgi:5-methylcytosine-specific restriction endonuclease McrA
MNGFGRVFADPDLDYGIRMPQGESIRVAVYAKSGGSCAECKTPLVFEPRNWDLDHRVPLMSGGRTVLSNIQALCKPCHREKTRGEIRTNNRRALTSRAWWMTHAQKDVLIATLRRELAEARGLLTSVSLSEVA